MGQMQAERTEVRDLRPGMLIRRKTEEGCDEQWEYAIVSSVEDGVITAKGRMWVSKQPGAKHALPVMQLTFEEAERLQALGEFEIRAT